MVVMKVRQQKELITLLLYKPFKEVRKHIDAAIVTLTANGDLKKTKGHNEVYKSDVEQSRHPLVVRSRRRVKENEERHALIGAT